MELHAKLVRSQLNFFKPLAENCSLELTRKGQDKLGELMTAMHRRETFSREHDFRNFQGAWIMPKDERRTGVILYLHGGGYTCGSLEYAKGFASTLATECGVRVFCAAYRLAPEHPFPAAVDDAMKAWDHLMRQGYGARDVVVAGDSAGGNLALVLCLKLRSEGRMLPGALLLMSPWTDMTMSGESLRERAGIDPAHEREHRLDGRGVEDLLLGVVVRRRGDDDHVCRAVGLLGVHGGRERERLRAQKVRDLGVDDRRDAAVDVFGFGGGRGHGGDGVVLREQHRLRQTDIAHAGYGDVHIGPPVSQMISG